MIKNYLLITLRNLLKNKLFIFINVFGMGVAIACCIVAYLNWEYSDKWDASFSNADNVYRVQFWREFQGEQERYGIIPMPVAGYVKQNIKDVAAVTRYHTTYSDMRIGEEIFGTQMAFADSAFFSFFNYKLKYGAFENFYDKSQIFISDETARKYYNKEDVVGEMLTQIILDKNGTRNPKEFIIGGVFEKKPTNNSFGFEVITLFDNFWDVNLDPDMSETSWKRWTGALFLKINDPALVKSVTDQLQSYVAPQNKVREDFKITAYYLQPFVGMMAANRANPRVNSDWLRGGIPDEAVVVPGIMSIMLLLLACFNFTNTSIAISSRRLKEIGIRKVMGGVRLQLVVQFLGENLVLCFLGLVAGLLLSEWMVPAYDALWPWLDINLSYTENLGFILFLMLLLVATALIAGSYPAFYITAFEPVSILKGKAKFGGTNWFTRVLLGGQFVIFLLSIIMGVAFYNNGVYQKNYDLGFATTGVLSAWVGNESAFNTYRDALVSNPDVTVIAGTRSHIVTGFYNDPVKHEALEREVDIMDVGDGYFEAMDMTLVSGRQFIKDSETDMRESVIITEEFAKVFDWKDDPIGKRLVWMDTVQLYVIGVVKNVYSRALWQPIEPMMIRYTLPKNYQQLVVKSAPGKMADVNAYMEKKWKEVFPNSLYNGQMIDQELQETNEINTNVTTMFGFLGFFAALMTGIGLYTLVSLNIVKRMKEIGVRKVLGASIANIAGVINFEFIVNLGIATLIGGALGFFAANALMDSIWEYYLQLNYISLIVSVSVMVLVAILAVGYKTISTARLNPTKTLRDE
jgi:ABC-type antimicrobial peptide transport system permease subunit